jgi:drug/metabolite transporter (DMT)-like permease
VAARGSSCSLCFVIHTLGAREFPGWSPLRFTALSATLGSVTVVAITELVTIAGWESTPSGHDVTAAGPALAYIVMFGAVIAVLSWNSAVQRLGAPTAVLFNNLVPITAFVIAIAGGYAPNAYELGGAALAIVALAAVTGLNRASAPAATPPRDRPRSPVAAGPRRAAAASAYAHTRSR